MPHYDAEASQAGPLFPSMVNSHRWICSPRMIVPVFSLLAQIGDFYNLPKL